MKIYTKKGDDGTTGLFYGGRVRKDSEQPSAYGVVDEAQAVLGIARVEAAPGSELDGLLVGVERDMYVLMAELATAPENRDKLTPGESSVSQAMVDRLEPIIDDLTDRFDAPKEFVLPGQTRVAAYLDLGRTVVRRAERASLNAAPPPSLVVPYLNRLSDLLWTMARWQEGEALPARTT
ncbi:MAG TPA: cob(I)yrinic acid a,c-diamide adenosyltransferase [Acidimicrobiales bacterium]|nr:cob(I)yrinic acid a,c-diamide adenosyltransferase [Acidimicrobiales bacterium]